VIVYLLLKGNDVFAIFLIVESLLKYCLLEIPTFYKQRAISGPTKSPINT